MSSPLFVLTTDLGTGSPPAAQLKAVLLSRIPQARILDLSHEIPPQSIRYAELALRSTAFRFPPATHHVVVVDPGVGTDRVALAVLARGQVFVGPDNGVLGIALAQPDAQIVKLDRQEHWIHPVSSTFHGRDIFAPVAAALAVGAGLGDVGSSVEKTVPSGLPAIVMKDERTVVGETLGADRFGNLMTNIPREIGGLEVGETWMFELEGKTVPFRRTYMAAKIGRMIVTHGADGYLEVAVTQGSAAQSIGVAEGTQIHCMRIR